MAMLRIARLEFDMFLAEACKQTGKPRIIACGRLQNRGKPMNFNGLPVIFLRFLRDIGEQNRYWLDTGSMMMSSLHEEDDDAMTLSSMS